MKKLKSIFARSVFRPIPRNAPMNDILAVLFHRLAASVYLIYTLWAIVSIIDGLPSIIRERGDTFQLAFSILVLLTTGPSCLGATFWPLLARIELFFGSSFVGLLILYLYFLVQNALYNTGSWPGFILIWSIIILPACRTVIVVILLLRQAKEGKKKLAEGK